MPRLVAAPLLAAVALLAGCGGSSGATPDDGIEVRTAFYPLHWVTSQVAGDAAEITNLTPPGGEPHDLELTPRQIGEIGDADIVVYLADFQPAVDEAVTQEAGDAALDVAEAAQLHAGEEEGTDEHAGESDHEESHGAIDPHFWLDPLRLADVADTVAERLADLDPSNAADYRQRAADVRRDLEALDAELADGLAGCAGTQLVTSHAAFGYLAERYGMEQVGITGLQPDAEPSPRDVARIAAFVRDHDVRTIYSETLVNPAVAETIARETGARTAVLDPLEGLTDASSGDDYLDVMRHNMTTIQEGQPCG
jgi:zinc transport system substrate-binding protein